MVGAQEDQENYYCSPTREAAHTHAQDAAASGHGDSNRPGQQPDCYKEYSLPPAREGGGGIHNHNHVQVYYIHIGWKNPPYKCRRPWVFGSTAGWYNRKM